MLFLIKIANVAQTIIMTKIFKRNVRSKKCFNMPNHNFRRFREMFTDSLRSYWGATRQGLEGSSDPMLSLKYN